MNDNQAKLTFYGGTGEVTGANFHVETSTGSFLVDCGMVQGGSEVELKNWDTFVYEPYSVDVLLITHAHQDHIGRIPKLVRDGFRGKIYSTAPTRELASVMLRDSMEVMQSDAKREGKEPLFDEQDLNQALALWHSVPYHNATKLVPGWTFLFREAGHILGSAMIEIEHNNKKILFTGDLGNAPNLLLDPIEVVTDADYVVMESVYGDRLHEHKEDRTELLERAIEDIALRKGTLMIPTFSLERTQEILYEINHFVESGRVPRIPVFLDSPLAIQVTEIFRNNIEFMNKTTRALFAGGDDVFSFPGLKYTPNVEDSKAINDVPRPKVIVAGSGMMNGGRILHHALQYLSDPDSILLFVGYQSPGTLGRVLSDGAKVARIFGNEVPVNCEIRSISGYSGHADRDDLVKLIEPMRDHVQQVFCVMGEPKSSLFLVQRLRDYLGVNATAPNEGDSVILDF